MPNYGAVHYNSGARYGDAGAPPKPKRMSKFALNLENLTDVQLLALATAHKEAMVGNVNFPTPDPTAAAYDADLQLFDDSLGEIAQLLATLASKYTIKATRRAKVEANLTKRGSDAEDTSNGDEAKMQTTVLPLQGPRTTISSMPAPTTVVASTGDHEGEMDVGCDAVPRAKSYLWQYREQIDGQVPGPWQSGPVAGISTATIKNLVSGRRYAVRVQALGPNELMSPWSDIAVHNAA